MRRVLIPLATLSMLLLGGCATDQRKDALTDTLNAYAGVVRWSDYNGAATFVDPKVREAHPVSPLEMSRYQQYKVSGYDEGKGPTHHGEFEVSQDVQINLVNVNTQSERVITDHQTWHYDVEGKHWWLVSGLPDISRQ
ncbi:hypothetical protein DVT68_18130 [Dyella solisilvae]|uniref:Lipoprotein n=1 Tax=Dyella solisilvae TaxID=1920168 RepID=A0A370K3R3_9GAMM|nr:hypothetical protein [Dyella solisilvae]RDI97269.1 hypothetical protein DVT68_18130 [Dyella solisilvae]